MNVLCFWVWDGAANMAPLPTQASLIRACLDVRADLARIAAPYSTPSLKYALCEGCVYCPCLAGWVSKTRPRHHLMQYVRSCAMGFAVRGYFFRPAGIPPADMNLALGELQFAGGPSGALSDVCCKFSTTDWPQRGPSIIAAWRLDARTTPSGNQQTPSAAHSHTHSPVGMPDGLIPLPPLLTL